MLERKHRPKTPPVSWALRWKRAAKHYRECLHCAAEEIQHIERDAYQRVIDRLQFVSDSHQHMGAIVVIEAMMNEVAP